MKTILNQKFTRRSFAGLALATVTAFATPGLAQDTC